MTRKREPNSGSFKSGHQTWNKGKKGLHHSPNTEWKKGQPSDKKLPIGAVTIRKRKREEHARAFIKIADPSVWVPRANWVWEQAFGKIPRGMVIHHRDRNPLNDDLDNLRLLSRAEHAAEHNHEMHHARYRERAN